MDNKTILAYINSHQAQIQSILAGAEEQIYNVIGIDVKLSISPPPPLEKKAFGIDELIHNAAKKFCKVWNVNVDDVFNGTRKRELVAMRQIIFYYIRETYPSISLTSIGEHLGSYDHSSVMHNIRAAKDFIGGNDEIFNNYFEPVKHLCNEPK